MYSYNGSIALDEIAVTVVESCVRTQGFQLFQGALVWLNKGGFELLPPQIVLSAVFETLKSASRSKFRQIRTYRDILLTSATSESIVGLNTGYLNKKRLFHPFCGSSTLSNYEHILMLLKDIVEVLLQKKTYENQGIIKLWPSLHRFSFPSYEVG